MQSDGFLSESDVGLSARADEAGFSPIRLNKGKTHILEIDPRTRLRIVNVQSECRVAFADIQDVVLHVFSECNKISEGEQFTEKILIVTDTTLMLCSKEGQVNRCVMVDRIKSLTVCRDTKALAIEVPSEFDMLLRFNNTSDRDTVVKVLRTVFRRLAHGTLPVEIMQKAPKLDPKNFRIGRPPNFRLTLIPQRTREQLRQALEVFEQEEEGMLEELDQCQEEMEGKHQSGMEDIQARLEGDLQKLRDSVREVWENESKLTRLREDVAKGRRLIEQVDGPFGPDGEPPVSKDSQIADLELIVARLNASVYATGSEQQQRTQGDGVTFFQKDLQGALFRSAWPGQESIGDIISLQKTLSERIESINIEIERLKATLEEGKELEAHIQKAEERIAYLRHLRRTGKVEGGGPRRGAAADNTDVQQTMEIYDPSYAWLSDLPQEITVESLDVDPRTGLHFVEVPPMMQNFFLDTVGTVLHFFAVVKKPSKTGELVKRVLLVGDQALYLSTANGVIKRCVDIVDISEIVVDTAFEIGVRTSEGYDLSFACATGEHRQEIIEVLQRVFKYLSGGGAIPVTKIPRHQRIEAFLKLNQPQGYVMKLTPLRSKQDLVDAIREKRDAVLHNAPIEISANRAEIPKDLRMPVDQYLQLRADVARQMEFEWRQDATLVQLRAQLDNTEKQLRAANDEAHYLKNQIDNHRCDAGTGFQAGSLPLPPGSGIVPSVGPGVFRPHADGLFFINVDPVQLNCELDILKLIFNKEYLFTGHANGFVNVWDLSGKNSLLRTLREHTGRVTDICFSEVDLLTSSADSTVRRWDLGNGRCTSVLSGHHGAVHCMHASGNRLLTGGHDGLIRSWDLERNTTVATYRGHHSSLVDLKFEGDMLVSIEWGWCLFWDLRSGKAVRSLRDEHGGLACLDFAEGIAVAGSSGGDMTVWDVSKGTGETISGHQDDVLCVQLAGKAAVSAGGDYKIKMWDLSSMKSLGVFYESHPFETKSFFMEGKRFIAGQGQFAKIWTK